MPTEMILTCSCVATIITIVSNAFMDRINMSLKIGLLCSLVITFGTWIPVHPMNLTDMLEQVTLFVGAEITLIALKFFVSVDILDVGFQVRGEGCFKLAGGEGALVHGALLETLTPLLDLNAGVKHGVHITGACAVILLIVGLAWTDGGHSGVLEALTLEAGVPGLALTRHVINLCVYGLYHHVHFVRVQGRHQLLYCTFSCLP